jgi:hypothetical protein
MKLITIILAAALAGCAATPHVDLSEEAAAECSEKGCYIVTEDDVMVIYMKGVHDGMQQARRSYGDGL